MVSQSGASNLTNDWRRICAMAFLSLKTFLTCVYLSILEPWPPWYDMMVLMFQREVAERIVARENDEAYGRLGVLTNWRAETKILFDISAAAFGQRRKMLRQSLKSLAVDPARLAGAAQIDLTRRAETIPVSGFVAMARELTDIRNTKINVP